MTIKKILLLQLILISNLTNGQTFEISGKIIANDKIELEYVSIGIINKSIGTVSDKNGQFILLIDSGLISKNDSLRFSMIGYSTKTYSLNQIIKLKNKESDLIIVLNKKIEQLSEIVVYPKWAESRCLGSRKKSLSNRVVNLSINNYKGQNLGSEIGRKFRIKQKKTLIESLKFKLMQNDFNSVKFRINVYSIKKGKPHKNLMKKNVIIRIKGKKTGWFIVNLSKHNIIVNNDIIVSVEWIAKTGIGKKLSMPIMIPTMNTHYYKFGSQNKWRKFKSMSTPMELKVRF